MIYIDPLATIQAKDLLVAYTSIASKSIIRGFQDWYGRARILDRCPTGEKVQDAFIKTVFREAGEISLEGSPYTRWLSIMAGDPEVGMSTKQFNELVNKYNEHELESVFNELLEPTPLSQAKYWEIFLVLLMDMGSGYMGTASYSIEPNDIIVLISGLSLPAILRPDGENYRFVASAFVYGIMQGEAWDGDSKDLKNFVLI
ncbi:MAG: hypothetical protein M1839_000002 [Geoglossum umbratile]|nr:MAG: hypothetical protein M1839_000002 [Geoglossum umbratile]